MSNAHYLVDIEDQTYTLFLVAIALRGGAIAVGKKSAWKGKGGSHQGFYGSLGDLNSMDYPTSGEPRTNAIAWALRKELLKENTAPRSYEKFTSGTTIEIWLSDKIAYGHLVDQFDVMPAVVSDTPPNQALRDLLTELSWWRNSKGVIFKIGYLSKENHPAYELALEKIPTHVKVLPTMTSIRKKDVRIIEGEDGLQELGEKCKIGGNSLLLKTEHRHLVPQESDDLDFLNSMDDVEEEPRDVLVALEDKTKTSRFNASGVVRNEGSAPKSTRRRDSQGRTSAEFFTNYQKGFGVFEFLSKLGVKFFGRYRDQDTPQPIEEITWAELQNPKINVYWGGSFGHKVGDAGPFDDFHSALHHVFSVLGLNAETYCFPLKKSPISIGNLIFSTYVGEGTPENNHEYLIVETVRGLLRGSNLLKGKEGLSTADVGRLEDSISDHIVDIIADGNAEVATHAVPDVPVTTSNVNDVLQLELNEIERVLADSTQEQAAIAEIEGKIEQAIEKAQALQEELERLRKDREALGEGKDLSDLKHRKAKILAFLEV